MCDTKRIPCLMCNNSKVDPDLTIDNDLHCKCIGDMPLRKRLMLCSGGGKPLRIEYEEFNDLSGIWQLKGLYYLNRCPECGRDVSKDYAIK